MVKILKPGFNDPDWTLEIECRTTDKWHKGNNGCGAVVEVSKDDLYLVHEWDMGGERDEVNFTCVCGVQVLLGDAQKFNFKDKLPSREDWLASHQK